jgi:hypothetical protein
MFEGIPVTRVREAYLPGAGILLFAAGPQGMPPGQRPVQPPYQPQYQPQYGYAPQAPRPEEGGSDSGMVLTILGIVTALFSVLIFISTFLPWITISGVSRSGFNLMTSPGQGFFMISWGWGGILFSGFFSLLFGALMIIPVILLLLNKRSGGSWCIGLGVLLFFIALVDVIMIYSTFSDYGGASVGAGLWSLLASAVVVLACGIVGLRFS